MRESKKDVFILLLILHAMLLYAAVHTDNKLLMLFILGCVYIDIMVIVKEIKYEKKIERLKKEEAMLIEERKAEDLGRVVIPSKIRKQFKIEKGDAITFVSFDDIILVVPKGKSVIEAVKKISKII